ncbi:MAG: DUF1592 domain-containing protein [Aureliella sp.]
MIRLVFSLCSAVAVLLANTAVATHPIPPDRDPQVPTIDLAPTVQTFLENNCLDCHTGADAEAGFDLDSLDQTASLDSLHRWVQVFDRVEAGEMPPKDYAEVAPAERRALLGGLGKALRKVQSTDHELYGRTPTRRLTNAELQRTLHDLLGIDVPLASLLPEEQRSGGFQNMAAIQSISHFQLENHLTVVDTALDAAFDRISSTNKPFRREYTARDLARSNPNRRCRDPEMRDGLAVVWSSSMVFYGRVTSTTVKKSGWYRIRVTASAVRPPEDRGVWCSVRSGRCNSGAPLMSWIGSFEASDSPKEMTYEAWIPKNHMIEIRPGDVTLKQGRFRGGQVGAGEGEPQEIPGVALHKMTVEEIFPAGSRDQTRRKLVGQVDINGKPSIKELKQQVRKFANRALRRDTTAKQLRPYMEMLDQQLASGNSPADALRSVYRALLCSPRFLYFNEPAGQLDDFAIASRLSYMLWGTMPDQELLKLARDGRLTDHETILAQVDRMLSSLRAEDFVPRFAAQWLDLLDIDFTEPDRKRHRNFDVVVQNSMLAETHLFIADLLKNNRPAGELVTADHTYLNSRLAQFYGIDGIEGDSLRRVELDASSHRGGLLTHGSILKVTANGTNTSPVLRGVWVSERLLGTPIPPPPENVPAIEPDVRGATTIREILEKHRADDSCAGCHSKIDPPGYALEMYDAAGRWRTSYDTRGKQRIDASFQLPDGREFESPAEFKHLWEATPKPIARCFAEKLMIFGTGNDITFADRPHIETVLSKSAESSYGLRSILNAVVTSPVFLSK